MTQLNPISVTTALAVILLTQLSGCDSSSASGTQTSLNSELPSPLTVAETITAGASNQVCTSGGIRLVYGLDHNRDGQVGPYESIGMEYLCNPTSAGENGPQVVKMGDGVPNEQKQKYLDLLGKS